MLVISSGKILSKITKEVFLLSCSLLAISFKNSLLSNAEACYQFLPATRGENASLARSTAAAFSALYVKHTRQPSAWGGAVLRDGGGVDCGDVKPQFLGGAYAAERATFVQ